MSLAEVADRRKSNEKKHAINMQSEQKKATGIIPVVFFVWIGFSLFVSKIMVLSC